ncbi:hypothetical protein F5X98DRAFT_388601 [Xylaria grammica]|nr:hypothetical protein F5X98DRAFT_388601 [Xylaria grammica]
MAPLSALSIACNIIDLVAKAAKGVATVVEVYKSVNGLSNNNEIINREADSLKDIVANLHGCQSQTPYNTADQRMREISAILISKCAELQSVLDGCRSSQKWGWLSASNASAKVLLKRGKIEQIQNEMLSSQNDLFRWIAASTRTAVSHTLQRLKDVSQTTCEIQTTLEKVDSQLDAWFNAASGITANLPGKGAAACLQDIREVVTDRAILQLLDFPSLKSRFEDVIVEEQGTFQWIFTEPETVLEKEPELSTTFPDWLALGSGIFHICGKPGSGKSTLMKYICRNPTTTKLLTKWSGVEELLVAKFFFWRIGAQEQKNLRGLIRGLLHQVLCKAPKLSRDIFSKECRDRLVHGLQKHSGAELESNEIMAAFSKLVEVSMSSPSQGLQGIRICLFIDGLDEFDNTKIGQSYRGLVEILCQWATTSDGHVKICVSSRIEEPFMEMFDKGKRFTLHNLTRGDINLLIEQSLERHPSFQARRQKSPSECLKLINNIRESANGVFLWVALVLKDIICGLDDGVPTQRLQKIVSDKPSDLDALLEQIMASINKTSRPGVEMLLSTVLRATGTLLSPEDRGPEYVFFDENPQRPFHLSALGSFLVLRAADTNVSMHEGPNMSDLHFEKEGWFEDNMTDGEVMKSICNILRTRSKGLVEVVDGRGFITDPKTVKFMHRSVPEFLYNYFSRSSAPNLSALNSHDHRATVAMSWAFLVYEEQQRAKVLGVSLSSFICGKAQQAGERWSLLYPRPPSNTDIFIHRLRQMKLGYKWEDLFRVLVRIDRVYTTNGYGLRFIDECARWGLHEFIDWLFRETDILADDTKRAQIMRQSLKVFEESPQCVPFTLATMETCFAHGIDGSVMAPLVEIPRQMPDKKLLWHCALLLSEVGKHIGDNTPHRANIVELWLRHRANPRVRFHLLENGGCIAVSSAPDGSGYTATRSILKNVYRVSSSLQGKGKRKLSLREIVLDWKPHNESRLLELLKDDVKDDVSGAQEPPKSEQDFSETGNGHGQDFLLPQEAIASLENPKLGDAVEENRGVTRSSQELRAWAVHIPIRLYIGKTRPSFVV